MIGPKVNEPDTFTSTSTVEDGLGFSRRALPNLYRRELPPLQIPENSFRGGAPELQPKRSLTHMRTGSTPIERLRSGRAEEPTRTPLTFTPSTSSTDLTGPGSASHGAMSAHTLPTPVSAPALDSHRFSPKPWEYRSAIPVIPERSWTPVAEMAPRSASARGHRRGGSESSSIMDRGRPRKRSDGRAAAVGATTTKKEAKRTKSQERRAFEELPQGWKPSDAVHHLSFAEATTVQSQAYTQAERFEILKPEDVENLSKELRSLDERSEYLRRTYTSLRTGRRNLHSRICQYLRSPRVARFSYESMLRQEEALAELDASIDDWVTKLEMAENRRTRVRQKLLEHVAAAAIMSVGGGIHSTHDTLQYAMGFNSSSHRIETPPRSPSKQGFQAPHSPSHSPSPQRVVAQVPSTIFEQPVIEDEEATNPTELQREDVQSIKVYAGDDLYTLLTDVEQEISKMNPYTHDPIPDDIPEPQRRQLHRQKSHEMLSGLTDTLANLSNTRREVKDLNGPTPVTPPAPTPPMKDEPIEGLTLTKAVFKP